MEAIMAGKKQTLVNFEDRFFDMLERRFDKQDERMDRQDKLLSRIPAIEEQTKKTNGRVTALEKSKERKFNIPTSVLSIIAACALIVLYIVARLMGVEVPKT